jgi:hypothetical protein
MLPLQVRGIVLRVPLTKLGADEFSASRCWPRRREPRGMIGDDVTPPISKPGNAVAEYRLITSVPFSPRFAGVRTRIDHQGQSARNEADPVSELIASAHFNRYHSHLR